MKLRRYLAAVGALVASLSASAEIKLHENFSTSGYVVGSYRAWSPDPGDYDDRFDLDAVKTLFSASFAPVTGVVSLYYSPGAPEDVTVLDAYATLALGTGTTVTAGKFLSYLGYEAFDPVNMSQISYANGDWLGPIPGYHSGVKVDYSAETFGFGLAVLDSVYSGPFYLEGDGELEHNAGFEGYYVYKGVPGLTVWAGFAYETAGNTINASEDILTLDLWVSYALSDSSTIAAEIVTKDGGLGNEGYNWLLFYGHTFDDNWSLAARISGEDLKDSSSFRKITVSPTYTVNANFAVRAEASYYDYSDYWADSEFFGGVQVLFKW